MALYNDLFNLRANSELHNRIQIATIVAGEKLRVKSGATANELAFARAVFNDPESMATKMFWIVLANNNAASIAQITGATDATIQAAVDSAAVLFLGAV